jgi:hypothetical protein
MSIKAARDRQCRLGRSERVLLSGDAGQGQTLDHQPLLYVGTGDIVQNLAAVSGPGFWGRPSAAWRSTL